MLNGSDLYPLSVAGTDLAGSYSKTRKYAGSDSITITKTASGYTADLSAMYQTNMGELSIDVPQASAGAGKYHYKDGECDLWRLNLMDIKNIVSFGAKGRIEKKLAEYEETMASTCYFSRLRLRGEQLMVLLNGSLKRSVKLFFH